MAIAGFIVLVLRRDGGGGVRVQKVVDMELNLELRMLEIWLW